jgi:DNA-binding NtrC family response regulator
VNNEAVSRARTYPVVTVLIVLGSDTSAVLDLLRHSNWDVQTAPCFEDAVGLLQSSTPAVVVAPYRSSGSLGWVDLLELLTKRCPTPRLVVTDRHADDSVWAGALSMGAYDVLAQPLDPGEVFRVLTAAWQAWWYDSLRNRATSGT